MCFIYDCIREASNTQVDNAKDIDVVIPMYGFIEYSEYFPKVWKFMAILQRWPIIINSVGAIIDFPSNEKVIIAFHLDLNNKVTGQIGAGGTKDVETLVLLKYLSDLWKTLERKLINCKINLILTWSANSTIVSSTDKKKKILVQTILTWEKLT